MFIGIVAVVVAVCLAGMYYGDYDDSRKRAVIAGKEPSKVPAWLYVTGVTLASLVVIGIGLAMLGAFPNLIAILGGGQR